MHTLVIVVVATCLLAGGALPGRADQTILGNKFEFKEKPGIPETRRLKMKATETDSVDVLDGDPAANGATVQVLMYGATSTSQIVTLPNGTRWRRYPSDPMVPAVKWRYRDSFGSTGISPVLALDLAKLASGKFKVVLAMSARYNAIDLTAPNLGTYAGVVITLGGGTTSCINFGGAVGGSITRNDEARFAIAKPAAEGTCPSGTPVCGDGVVLSPFETCDVGNDAACPGLCGTNGFPCLCPFCGDHVIDAGEACDRPSVGACTEGCSYTCECTTCGDGLVQGPAEECEPTLDTCGDGTCGAVGTSNQCQCPRCGDGIVNLAAEQCDGADDAACSGQCLPACTCP
ncbi:MAG: hypothetical protein ACREQL_12385 [Candidatus Binatia bacterium]